MLTVCKWSAKIAAMADSYLEKQLAYCQAGEPLDEHGRLTLYALGGLVPEDPDAARTHFEVTPPYKGSFAPPGVTCRPALVVKQENDYRLGLVIKMNEFISELGMCGSSTRKACKKSGLNRSLSEALRIRVPEFARMWKEAYEDTTDEIEEAAYTRAVNGVKRDVYYKGEVVGEETVYSDALLSMMLQARRSDVYKSRIAQEHTGLGGMGAQIQAMSDEELDAAINQLIAKRLALAEPKDVG